MANQPAPYDILSHGANLLNNSARAVATLTAGALGGAATALQHVGREPNQASEAPPPAPVAQVVHSPTPHIPAAVVQRGGGYPTAPSQRSREGEGGSIRSETSSSRRGQGSMGYEKWQTNYHNEPPPPNSQRRAQRATLRTPPRTDYYHDDDDDDAGSVRSASSSVSGSRRGSSRRARREDPPPTVSRKSASRGRPMPAAAAAHGHADDEEHGRSQHPGHGGARERVSTWLAGTPNHPPEYIAHEHEAVRSMIAQNATLTAAPAAAALIAGGGGPLDADVSQVLAERAANQLMDAAGGSKLDNLHNALLQLKAKVGSLSFNFRNDLFAWTECCTECFMKEKDGKPALCALVVMVILYGFGISLFFLHLQYSQYCDDNLTTIGAKAANVTCAGWTEECRIWGTTMSLKAYLQYRAAAYVLLLLPFLYLPYMVLVTINQMVTNIMGTLVDLAEMNEENSYASAMKQQNQTRLEKAEKRQNREKEWQSYGDTVHLVGEILSQMDKDGHNQVVLLLFFLFHGVMGGVSLYFDGSLYMTLKTHDSDDKCGRYQARLHEMAPDQVPISLEFLSMWHLVTGSVWMILTVMYLLVQFRIVMGARVVNRNKAAVESANASAENNIKRFLARNAAANEIKSVYEHVAALKLQKDQLQQQANQYAAMQRAQNGGNGWGDQDGQRRNAWDDNDDRRQRDW